MATIIGTFATGSSSGLAGNRQQLPALDEQIYVLEQAVLAQA